MPRPARTGGLVLVDIDATVVIAHSEKEQAAPTWKKTFGFHPLAVFADHGPGGPGKRWLSCCGQATPGRTPPRPHRGGPARAGPAAPSPAPAGADPHRFRRRHPRIPGLARHPGPRLAYSVGMTITEDMQEAILKIPAKAWTPAYDADRQVRPGAWVAEVTGLLNLTAWPKGMRVIVRKERPHPGAQLRFTDLDGHRFTCFATSTRRRPARRPGTAPPPPRPL